MKIHILPIFHDNYSYLLIDTKDLTCALVDPAEPESIIRQFSEINRHRYHGKLKLQYVLTTHHHWDHAGGNDEIKKHYPQVQIIGSDYEQTQGVSRRVEHREVLELSSQLVVQVFLTPCHTKGHVQYLVSSSNGGDIGGEKYLFCGDTFFVAGAGRFFEGDASQMTKNVELMKSLLSESGNSPIYMYPGHEYTMSNFKFASTVEPNNEALKRKMEECQALRNEGKPTVPTTLAEEFTYNPFFRVFESSVQEWAGAIGNPVETMRVVRERKDHFKA